MRRRNAEGWFFLAPAFIHLCVFALIPIGFALYLSFFKVNLIRGEQSFVGLQNYSLAFAEESFLNALWNSAKFALMSVPFGLAIALAVAILVNQKLKGITIFRTIYYIPAISSGVAIAMLWIYVFLPESGMINTFLKSLGFSGSTDFLNNVTWAMPALVFMSAWTGLGPRMVLFLAGLVGIPPSLYEAADLDGCSKWHAFWRITLPMLAPTTFFVGVTSTISAFQVFTPVYLMTKGGPDSSTDVVGYHIYTEAWVNFNTGIAAATPFVLLVAIALVAAFQFRLMRSGREGYAG
ncbi:MAG TPA: sugar ABC transporter permease [Fimbriimonadaceae bacterium]|nr:sugar ABC transporter permease [Fimbriimonadaceae bacterium]